MKNYRKDNFLFRGITWGILLAFCATQAFIFPATSYAQVTLPPAGRTLSLSPAFTPVVIRGVKIFKDNPFRFDFMVDLGDSGLNDEALKSEANKLVKYFLASLTIPQQDLWVNLSPREKDRIIPDAFGQTEMGRDLLAQDYILKQITSSLVFPENELGKKFWEKIYSEAYESCSDAPDKMSGGRSPDSCRWQDVGIDTFNRVWIVPEKAVVYAQGDTAIVVESRLKVLLQEDIPPPARSAWGRLGGGEATKSPSLNPSRKGRETHLIEEIILPAIEREVNEGQNFAALRQIYNSLILATWFKRNLQKSILGQKYVGQNKIEGVDVGSSDVPSEVGVPTLSAEKIYEKYLEAFKKGAYNYIKEDYDPATQQIVPRHYFSGGADFGQLAEKQLEVLTGDPVQLPLGALEAHGPERLVRVNAVDAARQQSEIVGEASAEKVSDRAMVTNPLDEQLAQAKKNSEDAWAKRNQAGEALRDAKRNGNSWIERGSLRKELRKAKRDVRAVDRKVIVLNKKIVKDARTMDEFKAVKRLPKDQRELARAKRRADSVKRKVKAKASQNEISPTEYRNALGRGKASLQKVGRVGAALRDLIGKRKFVQDLGQRLKRRAVKKSTRQFIGKGGMRKIEGKGNTFYATVEKSNYDDVRGLGKTPAVKVADRTFYTIARGVSRAHRKVEDLKEVVMALEREIFLALNSVDPKDQSGFSLRDQGIANLFNEIVDSLDAPSNQLKMKYEQILKKAEALEMDKEVGSHEAAVQMLYNTAFTALTIFNVRESYNLHGIAKDGGYKRIADEIRVGNKVAFLPEPEAVRVYSETGTYEISAQGIQGLSDLNKPAWQDLDFSKKLEVLARAAITYQVALHESGWVHEDIKPGNIVFKSEGNELIVMLIDFGISVRRGERGIGGTPPYQALGEKREPKHDMYSFGRMLENILLPYVDDPNLQNQLQWLIRRLCGGLRNETMTTDVFDAMARRFGGLPWRRPRDMKAVAEALREMTKELSPAQGTLSRVERPEGQINLTGLLSLSNEAQGERTLPQWGDEKSAQKISYSVKLSNAWMDPKYDYSAALEGTLPILQKVAQSTSFPANGAVVSPARETTNGQVTLGDQGIDPLARTVVRQTTEQRPVLRDAALTPLDRPARALVKEATKDLARDAKREGYGSSLGSSLRKLFGRRMAPPVGAAAAIKFLSMKRLGQGGAAVVLRPKVTAGKQPTFIKRVDTTNLKIIMKYAVENGRINQPEMQALHDRVMTAAKESPSIEEDAPKAIQEAIFLSFLDEKTKEPEVLARQDEALSQLIYKMVFSLSSKKIPTEDAFMKYYQQTVLTFAESQPLGFDETKVIALYKIIFEFLNAQVRKEVLNLKILEKLGVHQKIDELIARDIPIARIPGVLKAGRDDDGAAWFEAEDIGDGEDINGAIWGRLSPTQKKYVFIQAARALEFVHAAGWVHNDIKPGNIIVNASGRALLSDFGIASRIGEIVTSGTEKYRAEKPEKDKTTDAFSLAVVMEEKLLPAVSDIKLKLELRTLIEATKRAVGKRLTFRNMGHIARRLERLNLEKLGQMDWGADAEVARTAIAAPGENPPNRTMLLMDVVDLGPDAMGASKPLDFTDQEVERALQGIEEGPGMKPVGIVTPRPDLAADLLPAAPAFTYKINDNKGNECKIVGLELKGKRGAETIFEGTLANGQDFQVVIADKSGKGLIVILENHPATQHEFTDVRAIIYEKNNLLFILAKKEGDRDFSKVIVRPDGQVIDAAMLVGKKVLPITPSGLRKWLMGNRELIHINPHAHGMLDFSTERVVGRGAFGEVSVVQDSGIAIKRFSLEQFKKRFHKKTGRNIHAIKPDIDQEIEKIKIEESDLPAGLLEATRTGQRVAKDYGLSEDVLRGLQDYLLAVQRKYRFTPTQAFEWLRLYYETNRAIINDFIVLKLLRENNVPMLPEILSIGVEPNGFFRGVSGGLERAHNLTQVRRDDDHWKGLSFEEKIFHLSEYLKIVANIHWLGMGLVDIKESNILAGYDGSLHEKKDIRVVPTDFGSVLPHGMIPVSPTDAYAPENKDEPVSPAYDLYCFGKTLQKLFFIEVVKEKDGKKFVEKRLLRPRIRIQLKRIEELSAKSNPESIKRSLDRIFRLSLFDKSNEYSLTDLIEEGLKAMIETLTSPDPNQRLVGTGSDDDQMYLLSEKFKDIANILRRGQRQSNFSPSDPFKGFKVMPTDQRPTRRDIILRKLENALMPPFEEMLGIPSSSPSLKGKVAEKGKPVAKAKLKAGTEKTVSRTPALPTTDDLRPPRAGGGDDAMTVKDLGGIDLNPELLDLQEKGAGVYFNPDPAQLQNMEINGLTPIIFDIVPMTLPLFLGIKDKNVPKSQTSLNRNPLGKPLDHTSLPNKKLRLDLFVNFKYT